MVILVLSALRKELPIGVGPRTLAVASFILGTLLCRFLWTGIPDDASGRQIFESWLSSGIVGMFALLTFGIAHPAWRPSVVDALKKSARNGVSLVAASACVGIIIGIVQQTGIATDFSAVIKGVVETNLFLALLGIMVCSIVLGMGVPSVVCYLLMATLMGSLLSELGVIPLAAHLFIFYFGMMSMVTPPVALAAYASASIAEAPIMKTSFAAFRFSLVGFTLPFMFVYRPELLLLSPDGGAADILPVLIQVLLAVAGIVSLAVGIAGYMFTDAHAVTRTVAVVSAAMLLTPDVTISGNNLGVATNITGLVLLAIAASMNWVRSRSAPPAAV